MSIQTLYETAGDAAKRGQPAAVVDAPIAAPQIAAITPQVAAVTQPEAEDAADADGIFVKLPNSTGRGYAGKDAETAQPVCPPRCGFEYNFRLERTYVSR